MSDASRPSGPTGGRPRVPLVGEWQQGSRTIRIWHRADQLVLQASHAGATLALGSKADGTWAAYKDPGRGKELDGNGMLKEIYIVEITDTDTLLFFRAGKEGESPCEFRRAGSVQLAPAVPERREPLALTGRQASPPADKQRQRSLSLHLSPARDRCPRSDDLGGSPGRQRSRSRSGAANLVPRKSKGGTATGRGGDRNRRGRSPGRDGASRSRSPQRSGGDPERDRLVTLVKNRQRHSAETNLRWRDFCAGKEGRGIFDPGRHDSRFLQDYIDHDTRLGDAEPAPAARGASASPPRTARASPRGRGSPRGRSPSHSSGVGGAGGTGRRRRGNNSADRGTNQVGRDRAGRHARPRRKERGGGRKERGGRKRRHGERHRRKERGGRDGHRDRKQRRTKADRKSKLKPDAAAPGSANGSGSGGESSAASSDLIAPRSRPVEKTLPAAALTGNGGDAGETKAASEKKARLEAAVASAEKVKAAAVKALDDMKEDATNSMLDALEAERTRQDVQRARRVEAAEREARLLEEERIREARETREQAVDAARKAAEQEAQDEVEQAEQRLKEEMRSKIEAAEGRLRQATDDEEQAVANLEAASRASSQPKPLPLEDGPGGKVPPAAGKKAAARPPRREASEHSSVSHSGSSRSSEGSESLLAGKNSGASRSPSRSASPKAANRRRSTDAERSDGAARN